MGLRTPTKARCLRCLRSSVSQEDDAPPPEPEPVKPPEATMPESKGKEGKAKGKGKDGKDGKGKDGKDDGKPYLVVDPNAGAGVELTATCWGMHVDEVEDEPGQPHLQAGCTITAIDGTSLLGLEDEDAVVATFGEKFKNGAIIEVDPATFDTLELPPDATHWPVSFQEDLDMLASKFALDCSISKLGAPAPSEISSFRGCLRPRSKVLQQGRGAFLASDFGGPG